MWPWRYHASLWCWLAGHAEPLWHCGKKGNEWRCPDCGEKKASVLKHLKPGQLA